jgi:hypothetical protein
VARRGFAALICGRWLAGIGLLVALAEGLAQSPPATVPPPAPAFWRWAETPPMGWNSWDCFATTVTEAETMAQTDVMAAKLKSHGWQYIVVDIQWYEPNATGFDYRKGAELVLDEWGRLWPATNRFPSSANGVGFKALAGYVHGKGLKFGIHLLRGIPRQAVRLNTPIKGTAFHAADIADTNSICDWNTDMFGVDMSKPGAQEYYDSVFALIASWDVDFVKVDDLSRPYPRNRPEVEAIRKAIDRTGRPMLLSLSPGETPVAEGAHVREHANLWRISDDFWDNWPALLEQFERCRKWAPFIGPGHWPDADMLPLGTLGRGKWKTHFTRDEQFTLLTLWSVFRSPLMMGGDLTKLDDFTLALLTNDEILAVNQRSQNNRQLFNRDGLIGWLADVPDSTDRYLALFNTQSKPAGSNAPASLKVAVKLAELGFASPVRVRELWRQADLGESSGEFAPQIYWHSAGLYRVSGQRLTTAAVRSEELDRGVVACLQTNGTAYVGWRWLATDPPGVAFDVLRSDKPGDQPQKLNAGPITDSCNFVDTAAGGRAWHYAVRPISESKALAAASPVQATQVAGRTAFRSLRLQGDYRFDKVGIADLDGDGELDFVIKQPQQVTDPGVWKRSEDTFKIEAYKGDGTFLWRRDLGWNIEQGVWWSPMVVYDFDGDGKAEVALKTAPTDPVFRNETGRVLAGPEYCSLLDGLTGKELDRVDWPPRGNIADWGDAVGNRASRHLIGLAYLDGQRPSLIVLRGTYTLMLVDAYDVVGGKLKLRWRWSGDNESPKVRGQGMHGMHASDVDGDGRDEIVLGAAVIDDDGKLLWNLGMGHPDAAYVSDILPERPGLEIIYGFETRQRSNAFCLVEAKTGKLIWGCDHPTTHIHSQGLFADIDPENPGPEFYDGEKASPERWLYSARDGKLLSREDFASLAPSPVFWDDTPFKAYVNRGRLLKYRGPQLGEIEGRVVAVGDFLGDWREEILTSVPGELRIYTTTIPSTSLRVCALQDRAYRSDVALAAMGYLYPPQVGTVAPAAAAGAR